jgi:hypothetical protein
VLTSIVPAIERRESICLMVVMTAVSTRKGEQPTAHCRQRWMKFSLRRGSKRGQQSPVTPLVVRRYALLGPSLRLADLCRGHLA